MAYAIDLWKIVLDSNCSKETRINIKNGLDELNAKAKAFDDILNVDYIVAPDDYAHEVTKIVDKYMEDK